MEPSSYTQILAGLQFCIRVILLKLLDEVENMCAVELLFQTNGQLPQVDLYALKDNPNRKEAGYYFATERPELLDDGRRYVMHNLKRSEKRNDMFQIENEKLKFLKRVRVRGLSIYCAVLY